MMDHHWWPSIFHKKPWWPSHFQVWWDGVMDHQISDNISITINLTKIPQKVGFFQSKSPKTWAVALFKIGVAIKWIWCRLYSKNFTKKIPYLKFFWSYWYIKWWMMAMDSIKFWSVHLMDDGDGHHNFGIDGDGDGHHFKGDGRHVWLHLMI